MSGNRFWPRAKLKQFSDKRSRATKTAKQLERHLKGVANHRRITILFLVAREEGINVEGIASALQCNFKTISEHTRRLVLAGLLEKQYAGNSVKHRLSPYGKTFLNFLNLFSNS
mgnify:CR=1 FL=1